MSNITDGKTWWEKLPRELVRWISSINMAYLHRENEQPIWGQEVATKTLQVLVWVWWNIGIPLEVLHRRCPQNSHIHRPTPRTTDLDLFFFFSLSLSLDLLIHTSNDKLASCFFLGMRIMGLRCEPVFSGVFSDPFKPEFCFFSIEKERVSRCNLMFIIYLEHLRGAKWMVRGAH